RTPRAHGLDAAAARPPAPPFALSKAGSPAERPLRTRKASEDVRGTDESSPRIILPDGNAMVCANAIPLGYFPIRPSDREARDGRIRSQAKMHGGVARRQVTSARLGFRNTLAVRHLDGHPRAEGIAATEPA